MSDEVQWCEHQFPAGSPCDKCEIKRLRAALEEIVDCPHDSEGFDDSKLIAREALEHPGLA